MKAVKRISALSLVIMVTASAAHAQLRYPASVQTTPSVQATSFDYYAQDDETSSPSDFDVPTAPAEEDGVMGNGGNATCSYGAAPSCGCNSGCNTCCSCKCDWCNLGDPFTLTCEDSCIKIGGWFQTGYSSNEQPFSDSKGDVFSFNDATGNLDLHQAYVYIGKEADTEGCHCWDWGFRFDMLYGTDAQKTQAFGNQGGINNPRDWDNDWDHGRYGWAIPQLYAELAVGDLSVIVGHFYTIVGYEVIPAADNFFFSHAFTMFNEPFTHTGILSTYKVSDCLTVYGGWTAGWDTGFDQLDRGNSNLAAPFNNGYDTDDGSNFLGGFSINNCDETASFTYITTYGDFGWRGADGYAHSMVLDLTLCENINYVVQSDYVHTDQFDEDTVGVNQYLFYTVNDCLKAGFRFEWFKEDFFGIADGVALPADVYAATFGLNVKPHANIVIRPEVRHNWDFEGFHDQDITVFGVDSIVTF